MATFEIKNQGDYPAVYTFSSNEIDNVPNDWTDISDDNATALIIDNFNKHRYIIELIPVTPSYRACLTHTFTSGDKLSGIVEFWVATEDYADGEPEVYLRKSNDDNVVAFRLTVGWFTYMSSTGSWINMGAPRGTSNTWYHISIRWRATGGTALPSPDDDLIVNKYRIYVSEVKYGDWTLRTDTDVDKIIVRGDHGGSNPISYVDAIGWSWDSNYDVGDNLLTLDTNITSDTVFAKIINEVRKIPSTRIRVVGQTFEEDSIIQIKDNYTSKHNGKGNYKDSLDFRDDTIGSAPSNTDEGIWTDNSGASCDAYIIDHYNGLSHVIQLEDYNNAASAELDFALPNTTITDGSIEFKIATTDPTYEASFRLYDENAVLTAGIKIDAENIYYYHAGAWVDSGEDALIGVWYRCTITFDCDVGTIAYSVEDVFNVSGKTLHANTDYIEDLKIITQDTDKDYLVFIGAIGFTWDSNYSLGDNADLEVTLSNQIIFEGSIEDITKKRISVLNLRSLTQEVNSIRVSGAYSGYKEEQLADIINTECDHLKVTQYDEIYRGTHNFLNNINNAKPMGFVCDGNVSVAAESKGSHKQTVEFDDNDAGSESMIGWFEDQTYGSVEFWYYCNDPTKGFFVELRHGTTVVAGVGMSGDEFQYIIDATGNYANCVTITTGPVLNTQYRIKISFECTSGTYETLPQYHYAITVYNTDGDIIDGIEDDIDFDNDEAHIDNIKFYTSAADSGHLVYIGSIGYSWENRYPEYHTYILGDNDHLCLEYLEPIADKTTITYQGYKTLMTIINQTADEGGFETTIKVNDNELIMNAADDDSGISIASTDKIWAILGKILLKRINKVILIGGIGTTPAESVDQNSIDTYGERIYKDTYAHIEDQTELNNLADTILAREKTSPLQVKMWRYDNTIGFVQPIENFSIGANIYYNESIYTITVGNYYLKALKYEPLKNINHMVLNDGIIIEEEGDY